MTRLPLRKGSPQPAATTSARSSRNARHAKRCDDTLRTQEVSSGPLWRVSGRLGSPGRGDENNAPAAAAAVLGHDSTFLLSSTNLWTSLYV
jgi:hypothetical protein